MVLLQSIPSWLGPVVDVVHEVMTGVLIAFGIAFWASIAFLVTYLIYRYGPPGMRARALEEIINWGVNHVTTIVAAVIILYILTAAINMLAGGGVVSFGTVLYEVLVNPIVQGFHLVFG